MTQILALDTSTEACSAALTCDGETHERFEIAPRRHSALLLPMVEDLMHQQSLQLADLDAIAFTQGPGSFMGLRIAAGVAQGLAFAARKPVISVSTLQALAQAAHWKSNYENILAGWDARMQAMYWGAYVLENDVMQPMTKDRLDAPAQFALPDQRTWQAAGNAWEIYAIEVPTISNTYPTAYAVAFLASKKLDRGEIMLADQAQPIYLRNQIASPNHTPERI